MNCDHEETRRIQRVVADSWTGELEYRYEYVKVSTCVDLDVHRYQCGVCKKIMFYGTNF